ncbi:MAG: type II toxin-antitoxin system VapC family toxin [Terracidiphilus sp.]|jgi:predicted nucleic acid-binding protein
MILADTTIWIDHLNNGDREFERRLNHQEIVMHPFVAGELALGPLPDRKRTILFLDGLPRARVAQQSEVRYMIEAYALHNRGIGLIDAHLIAAVLLNPGTVLWTRDGNLRKIAIRLKMDAHLP